MGALKINHQVGNSFDVLQKSDLVLISSDENLKGLTKIFCEKFQLKCVYFNNAEDFHKFFKISLKPSLVVWQFPAEMQESEVISQYKNLKTILRKAPLCLISSKDIGRHLNPPDFCFQNEKMATEVVQYLMLLKLKGENYEIKYDDLFPSSIVSFNAYHLTPISRKFLPVVFHHLPLSEKKFSKLEKIKKLFIKASDTGLYRDYVESFFDDSDFGSKKRAKAHLFEYIGRFYQLKYMFLTGAEPDKLATQLKELQGSLFQLRTYLDRIPQPFYFIFAHTKNEFLALDHSWFVAIASSYIGLILNWPQGEIFSKIGMVSFPLTLDVPVQDRFGELSPTDFEKAFQEKHAAKSAPKEFAEDMFPYASIHQFFTGFVKLVDFNKEIPAEDFMSTAKSYWRSQSEADDSEPTQKLLNAICDVFCNK